MRNLVGRKGINNSLRPSIEVGEYDSTSTGAHSLPLEITLILYLLYLAFR
jgi:hypothetical protein